MQERKATEKEIMKTLTLAALSAVLFAGTIHAKPSEAWLEQYDSLLKKYVTPTGVKYGAWKANAQDMAALDNVIDGISTAKASGAKTPEQLAFHINAYNAWILHNILEKYPVGGPLKVSLTFFHGNNITVAGRKMSFDTLEQKNIRPRFQEPRVHFALNCASVSCPPLLNEAFRGEKLDSQLQARAVGFVNSEKAAKVSKKEVALSKIFDWYKDDFASSGGAVTFINKFRKNPLPADLPVTFQKYDWALNEAR
jgi:hypothetical protein